MHEFSLFSALCPLQHSVVELPGSAYPKPKIQYYNGYECIGGFLAVMCYDLFCIQQLLFLWHGLLERCGHEDKIKGCIMLDLQGDPIELIIQKQY